MAPKKNSKRKAAELAIANNKRREVDNTALDAQLDAALLSQYSTVERDIPVDTSPLPETALWIS